MRKPSPAISMWILITVAMVIFIGVSLCEDIKIGNFTLTKSRFPEVLLAKDEQKDNLPEITDTIPSDTIIPKEEIEPDTTVHSLLIFGDSMTHNLGMSVAKYGTKNNYKVTSVTWESSSIPGWSNSGKIKEYIEMSKPDFIIISLGSNEMGLKHFEKRIPDVSKIVEQVGDKPYVWVGPPLWKEDQGIYKMLEEALPPGMVFRTEGIEIPRGGDKIHPTMRGAEIWADTLMRWISHSKHPILTEKPDSGTTTKGHRFIYLHPND